MSLFNPNIPNPTDFLSDSQLALKNNNGGLNTVFNVDHYTFNNATANKGFHNTVTTPLIIGSVHPTPAANVPKFYAMQSTANVGVLQYSRACSSGAVVAAPTPLTNFQPNIGAQVLQAFPGPGNTISVLDFSGITNALGEFFLYSTSSNTSIYSVVIWTGSAFRLFLNSTSNNFVTLTSVGNVLTVLNNGVIINDVYWSLKFHRLAP